MRVVDPDGTAWEVAREWFRRPDWSRDTPDPGDEALENLGERISWIGLLAESWWGAIILLFAGLIVALVFFVLLPVLLAIVGIAVAAGLLGARLLSISTFTVWAHSSRARVEWRIRGAFRSARAVREVAAGIERGDEWPLIDGKPPVSVTPPRV